MDTILKPKVGILAALVIHQRFHVTDESAFSTGIGGIYELTAALPTRTLDVGIEDSITNTVLNILRLTRQSSGTPAAGIGVGMEFELETSATNNEIACKH